MNGLKQSPWILHYDASSCNGCDIETLACLTPMFDVERLGVINTGNPKHADLFLVTGAVNEQSKGVIRNLYRQLPEPNVVVAVGACASTGGIFRECYNISGGVDCVVPVDVYVPGCAARPEAIIDGVLKGLAVMVEKHSFLAAVRENLDKTIYAPAEPRDAESIHVLRQICWRKEAVLHEDESFPVLQQTLKDLEGELHRQAFFKAAVNGKIIGAVSGCLNGDTIQVDSLVVHPFFQNDGVAAQLLHTIEVGSLSAKHAEICAGNKSERLLQDLARAGYQSFKTEVFTPKITWVYLRKDLA